MPEFVEQAIAESDGGALTWMLSALDMPNEPAILHGYGTIIGTGNAIMEWPSRNWGELMTAQPVKSLVVLPTHTLYLHRKKMRAGVKFVASLRQC